MPFTFQVTIFTARHFSWGVQGEGYPPPWWRRRRRRIEKAVIARKGVGSSRSARKTKGGTRGEWVPPFWPRRRLTRRADTYETLLLLLEFRVHHVVLLLRAGLRPS